MNKKKLVILICSIMALVIIVCIGVLTSAGNRISKIEDKLSLSEKYLEELEYEKALAVYKEILQIDPKNVEAYLGMADVYIAMNEYAEALGILEEGSMETGDAGMLAKKSEVEAMLTTIEPAEKEVEEVVDETVEDITEEILEEVVEEPNYNAKPVDWTGYGEGQISIMYIDGTIYEAQKHKNDPESLAFIRLNEEQNYECDSVTIGIKSYGDVFTYNSELKPEDFNTTLYSENGKPEWLYRHDLWATKEIFAGATFSEDLSLFEYFFMEAAGVDAYTINGMEFYTVQDFVDVFGKPYGIYYVYDELDDAAKGDESRYYVYDYKVGECYLALIFEMSNADPGNCTIKEVALLNPTYEGNLEDNFYVTE